MAQFRGNSGGQRDLRATTSCSNNMLLGADLSADRGPEQLAMFAVEPGHLHLLDRKIVRRTCVDLDAWQQQPEFEVLQIGRLPYHVLAREFITALLQHLNHGLRGQISVDTERARLVAFRE